MNNLEKKIKDNFPNEDIDVIHYTTMKEFGVVRCNSCNTEYKLTRAENFIRSNKKCICTKCINNNSGGRLTKELFQNKINQKYPDENLEVLNYTLKNEECSIKCLNCNSILTLNNASSFLNKGKKRVCTNCIPNKIDMLNNLKQEFKNYISDNPNDFKIITDIDSHLIKSDSLIESKCLKCGEISSRTMRDYLRGRKCPFCANNHKYSNEEYQNLLGDEYTLLSNYQGMEHSVLIKHNLCGFCYSKNARHYYCPKCSGSKGEKTIAFLLEKYNIDYEREKIEFINNHKLRFDFYISAFDVYIEFQGLQHFQAVGYFGGKEAFIKQQEYDKSKIEWIKNNNKTLLIINYDEDIETKLFNFLLKFNDHLERE